MIVLIATAMMISGAIFLYFGADWLVTGSSKLAARLGVSSLIIGLTIVAFGTSAPELVVSLASALKGNPDIALGNVLGSNICNIGLILGLTAIISPITVHADLIKRDLWIMIGGSVLLAIMALTGSINRFEGAILAAGIIGYIWLNIRIARKQGAEAIAIEIQEIKPKVGNMPLNLIMMVAGLVLLVIGANVFVDGAVFVAQMLDVSDAAIGLTIVAIGTSLPELATSVVAAAKGEGDISLGNIVGSNIFNIFAILGVTSLASPIHAYGISIYQVILMFVFAIIAYPIARTGMKISRTEGIFLFVSYCAFLAYMAFEAGY